MQQSSAGFADVNGAKIYYEISGEGHPLFLLHAGVGDSRMWDDQFAAFARHYRTIRYDARAYGKTAVVPGRYTQHEDLLGLMDFLGIERAHLLGCSMGGQTIIDFALAYPDRVGALIPVGSAVSGFKGQGRSEEERTAMMAAYERGDLDECAELTTRTWVDGPQRTPDQVSAAVRQKAHEMMLIYLAAPDGVDEEVEADPPALDRLGMITAPTLVIYGDIDQPDILTIAEILATRIPGARKVVISGTAHVPHMERPEEFNRLVLDFLADL